MDEVLDEQAVEALMQTLEKTLEDINAASKAKDAEAQNDILLRMLTIERKISAFQTTQNATFARLMDLSGATDDDERVARLLQALELGAQLRRVYRDVIGDDNASNTISQQAYSIGKMLDEIGTGRRAALAPLLDHSDPEVRAIAATGLMEMMPERAYDILRDIDENERGTSAWLTAHFALAMSRDDKQK